MLIYNMTFFMTKILIQRDLIIETASLKRIAYLAPNLRVERLSDAFEGLGEEQQSKEVWELPPCKLEVKLIQIIVEVDNDMGIKKRN